MPVAGPSDSWDDPSTEPRPTVPVVRRDDPVPDDWDDDGEEEDEVEPTKIWEEANRKAPMPQVILASTASSASTVSPPPAAFQPSIRILKRPSATSNSQPATSAAADAQQKSFVQREADYQLARERIFGGSSNQAETTASSVLRNDTETSRARRDMPGSPPIRMASPQGTTVIRNPRGPDTTAPSSSKSIPVKGFKDRKPHGSPSSN